MGLLEAMKDGETLTVDVVEIVASIIMSCMQHASVQMFPQLPDASSSSMRRITNLSLILLIVIRTTSFVAGGALQPQHHHGGGCFPAERAALLSFKKGITNDSTNLLGSWSGQDCCRWRGIECSNQTGHVIKLQLRNQNPDMNWFGYASGLYGEISPSLLSLKHLEYMDLSMNFLLGPSGRIPHFMGSLESLRYLNLSGIPFTGTVPPQLGNLSKLQYLDLSQAGMVYSDITWLTRLSLLQYIGLTGDLSGIANWPHTLNMIPSLRVISLHDCSLNSASQSLTHFNLTKLEKLDLSRNYLGHSIASGWFWKATSLKYLSLNFNGLLGQFPAALGNMTSLQVLDLSNNNLNKTRNLNNLCSLEILDLTSNLIKGGVMEWLPKCKMNKLQELHFSDNSFTGTLPNFIGQFTSLRILDLFLNQLSGSLPTEIGALTTLTYLAINNNNITGSMLAELGKLRYLTDLDLSDNKITGPVPTEIGSLSNLIFLNLARNNFSGVIIEEHLAGLKSLKHVDLSSNNLKVVMDSDWLPPFVLEYAMFSFCQMGPFFPAWLQHQGEIIVLDISSTSLKGVIPDWFWSTFSQATYLNIANNQISGSLPANLDDMACLELYLGSNRLTGHIPLLPANIITLDISNNRFSGTVPSNVSGPDLQILLMYSNQIDGYIPESLCKSQQLSYLDLSNNILKGEIPQCFDRQNIQFLLLSNNSLSGKFPVFLQNNTHLEFLDLAWNKFSGRLPTWIGELSNLRFLLLGHNIFSGNIPVEITNLRYLQYLDLSDNNLSGTIPWHLTNLTFMKTLQNKFMLMYGAYIPDRVNYRNYINGADYLGEIFSVITKGQQLIYGRTFAYFVSIDLSSNFLTGEIPIDTISLVSLMNLNLSSNQLSGRIPRMIGAMQSLVSLDLSTNKISGKIPSSLSNLSSLSYLNLSYNNLSGRIPSGRQLDTLNVDNPSLMYIGNIGLCGPPLQKNCSGNDTVIHGYLSGNKQEFDPTTFYFGLVLGLVTGHWMMFCVLLFKKTWRIAYFRFFDKMYDNIYVFVIVKWASFSRNTTTE